MSSLRRPRRRGRPGNRLSTGTTSRSSARRAAHYPRRDSHLRLGPLLARLLL